MSKVLVGLVAFLMVAGVAMAHCGSCDGDPKTASGVVTVVKSQAGDVAVVKVAECVVTLDDNGKKVAAMDGKKVEVTGKMKDKKLVVETVKAVEDPNTK